MLTLREIIEWPLSNDQIKQIRKSCHCNSHVQNNAMNCDCEEEKTQNHNYKQK